LANVGRAQHVDLHGIRLDLLRHPLKGHLRRGAHHVCLERRVKRLEIAAERLRGGII
jgi:hypothetical protein